MQVFVREFSIPLPPEGVDANGQTYVSLPRYTSIIAGSLMLVDERAKPTAVFHAYVEPVDSNLLEAIGGETRRNPFYWRRPGQVMGSMASAGYNGPYEWVGTIGTREGRLLLFRGVVESLTDPG